jgi:FkbM family methyltransferase
MDVLSRGDLVPDKAAAALDITALAASPRVRSDGGYLPPMVSHAQNFEDVMLRRALQDIKCGYYIDIGAADPVSYSVTHYFYQNGWRGINVEPDPRHFNKLQEQRPEDKNLQCVIGAESATVIFNVAPVTHDGWSTGSAERAAEITNRRDVTTRPILVPAITLDQLLALSCGRVVDFLKIDAEDMEGDILGGSAFASQRPRIIVAEATRLDCQLPSHQVWEPKLLSKGYQFAWFDGLNRFYVRCEDEWRLALFRVPPCVFDNFFAVTIEARIAEVREQAAQAENDLNRALATARAEACAVRQQVAEAAERHEAALSAANANAVSANARSATVAGELQRITAEFDRLKESLAQRDGDYRRVQQRLIQMEISRRNLLEQLRREDNENQELNDRLARRDDEFQELEQNAEQLASDCQELAENLEQREEEIGLLTAERDKAAAQNLHWFAAAIPNDGERLRSRRQYPLQTLLYRSRLLRWLAVGLRRRQRRLMETARRARDRRNWALAARYYRDALDLAPDRPGLWVQFGHALKEAGHIAAAEKAYRTSLGLDAQSADTHLQLGHALKLQGRNAEAAEAYMRALSLAPGSPEAMNELRALGSPPAAAEHAGRALHSAAD